MIAPEFQSYALEQKHIDMLSSAEHSPMAARPAMAQLMQNFAALCAQLRDVSTASAGIHVPLLDAQAKLEPSMLPSATRGTYGVVSLLDRSADAATHTEAQSILTKSDYEQRFGGFGAQVSYFPLKPSAVKNGIIGCNLSTQRGWPIRGYGFVTAIIGKQQGGALIVDSTGSDHWQFMSFFEGSLARVRNWKWTVMAGRSEYWIQSWKRSSFDLTLPFVNVQSVRVTPVVKITGHLSGDYKRGDVVPLTGSNSAGEPPVSVVYRGAGTVKISICQTFVALSSGQSHVTVTSSTGQLGLIMSR